MDMSQRINKNELWEIINTKIDIKKMPLIAWPLEMGEKIKT